MSKSCSTYMSQIIRRQINDRVGTGSVAPTMRGETLQRVCGDHSRMRRQETPGRRIVERPAQREALIPIGRLTGLDLSFEMICRAGR